MPELDRAIAFLMDVNYRLAGNDAANALVASLQLRAGKLRDRHVLLAERAAGVRGQLFPSAPRILHERKDQ